MFKNITIYRIAPDWAADLADAEARIQARTFAPCTPAQVVSAGWVPPRNEGSTLIESIDGHWHARLRIEVKKIPPSVVNARAEELAAAIERQVGRKPGKKQMKELKEQAFHELLPAAFPKRSTVGVWIDVKARRLVIDASAAGAIDEALTLLCQALPGFAAFPLNTNLSPATVMADWLVSGEPPAAFTVDGDAELKADDGEKPTVRYMRHQLDTDEVREHIQKGKRPTKLSATFADRVSFTLTDAGQVKKLKFLDGVFEDRQAKKGENFDADAAIMTGELTALIGALVDAMGGEAEAVAWA